MEAFAVFGGVDAVGGRADDVHAVFNQRVGEFERGLTAVMHNHAPRVFGADDFQHVFQCQRLEIEAVAGVEVGGHGFGVAVHHNRFKARFAQGECGVNAAIVKLDALADAVRAAAENHHFLTVGRARLAFFFVSGIEVGGFGGELGGAGIDAFIDGMQLQRVAVFAHFFFFYT